MIPTSLFPTPAFDLDLIRFFTSFSDRYPALDKFLVTTTETPLIKAGLLISLYFAFWYSTKPEETQKRGILIVSFVASFFVGGVTRLLSIFLPYRPRPIHLQDLGFHFSSAMPPHTLDGWNAFPSDTAALCFALSTGIWLHKRWVGYCAYLFSIVVVCLPRIYLGLHFPTDMIAGGLFGILFTLFLTVKPIRRWITEPAFWFEKKMPEVFYSIVFLMAYEVAVLFHDVEKFGHLLKDIL